MLVEPRRESYEGLPAGDRVERGLDALETKTLTPESLALCAATTRLRELGVPISEFANEVVDPELKLYEALAREEGDAYYRYNALRRELDSFISALESRRRRQKLAAVTPASAA